VSVNVSYQMLNNCSQRNMRDTMIVQTYVNRQRLMNERFMQRGRRCGCWKHV